MPLKWYYKCISQTCVEGRRKQHKTVIRQPYVENERKHCTCVHRNNINYTLPLKAEREKYSWIFPLNTQFGFSFLHIQSKGNKKLVNFVNISY